MYPTILSASSTGGVSYTLSATQNIKKATTVELSITALNNAVVGSQATVSLYLAGVTKNIVIDILRLITKGKITIPVISDIVNNITQTITLSYNNGGDTDTIVNLSRVEPRGIQASITSKTTSNFVVRIFPSSSYVGIVSITISTSNIVGQTTVTLVLNLIQKANIPIPIVSDVVNDITQTITLSYNNGGDSNTSITISKIEPTRLTSKYYQCNSK